MGPVSDTKGQGSKAVVHSLHCQTDDSTNRLLRRFWEVEELHEQPPLSPEERECERHFRETHSRDETGRYSVHLPFKLDPSLALKPCRSTALKLLLSCERRLASNEAWRDKYSQFMEEYAALDHMEAVPESAVQDPAYYLPHHAVVKRYDPSGKIRVVFNASFRTATGSSLNDCLMPGPKLQSDLWMILTRWRLFRVVFTSDIVKMFRQIRVHHTDADWTRILWRSRPDQPVQDFRLKTVTYGTACAPFLALRVLVQLAEDEEERFPLGAVAIRRHSYVDDILAGADDEKAALELRRQVISILQSGGFDLSKWASNKPSLQEAEEFQTCVFQDYPGVSTLGVVWRPNTDTFSLRVLPPLNEPTRYTKRRILSEVASLFDPLGWAAPVLIFAKILMQDLWIIGAEWDEDLPEQLLSAWETFRSKLSQLDALAIPRWTNYSADIAQLELHGFCDASQRAYAAVVYLRVSRGESSVATLLVAKTKVAPVKALSIPRLELCGAVLLSKLIAEV
ncbi:uncharacterized protein LOC114882021 [Osmia bicornis bicornis]|uniref:uncharacterized protein LOC114882021 n=1 Tax=Osmia bicornis bicornis TaxID=1437191 RepID=UPI001EAF2A64|nr:uncharacterized protein LOC114882021 [Osmia bicornis bicornis]